MLLTKLGKMVLTLETVDEISMCEKFVTILVIEQYYYGTACYSAKCGSFF